VTNYEVGIDLGNPNTSHTQVIDFVGFDKAVLDVGCAAGDVARALKSRGCRVSGVEIDATAAEVARPDLEKLVIADLDQSRLSDHFEAGSFDAIVFADVLEHLKDPGPVLEDALSLLSPRGHVVVSIPNVAHGAVRLALLQGRWRYTDRGLLDSTHVRFFTRQTVVDLLEDSGLVIEELRSTVADPIQTEVDVDGRNLPVGVVEWVRDQPEALAYQFVASARPLEPGEERGRCPELVPVLPEHAVRLQDAHTQQTQEDLEARRRLLTTRDHVIGLEARAASAEARVAEASKEADLARRRATEARSRARDAGQRLRKSRRHTAEARRRAREANQRLRRARRQAAARERQLKDSTTWRLGRTIMAPVRLLRKLRR
jgi:2-polyprenyl-3-methyl-5-hydroxy-6-metoxy-1,4-benzoquinol methylase